VLKVRADAGRIDLASNGSVSVLAATSEAVLEVAADIFAVAFTIVAKVQHHQRDAENV
jgi:hypothetical protein